jgi:hypothetical protein
MVNDLGRAAQRNEISSHTTIMREGSVLIANVIHATVTRVLSLSLSLFTTPWTMKAALRNKQL